MDDADFDLDPVATNGAVAGARVGLQGFGIEADHEICTQVALSVLYGFVSHGGLEGDGLIRLRTLVMTAVERVGQSHGH